MKIIILNNECITKQYYLKIRQDFIVFLFILVQELFFIITVEVCFLLANLLLVLAISELQALFLETSILLDLTSLEVKFVFFQLEISHFILTLCNHIWSFYFHYPSYSINGLKNITYIQHKIILYLLNITVSKECDQIFNQIL